MKNTKNNISTRKKIFVGVVFWVMVIWLFCIMFEVCNGAAAIISAAIIFPCVLVAVVIISRSGE